MTDLLIVIGLLGGGALYARGSLLSRVTTRRQVFCGALSFVILTFVLLPPYDGWADRWFSVHMGQHMLIILVVAPLMVMGKVPALTFRSLPLRVRRRFGRVRRNSTARRIISVAAVPAVVWSIHVVAVWTWHVPALYDEALRNDWVHGSEHLIFLLSAIAFWNVVASAGTTRGANTGVAMCYLIAAGLQGSVLGAILLFSSRPLYQSYAVPTAHGMTPLQDQQVAGLVMWLPGSVIYLIGVVFVFLRWFNKMESRADEYKAPARAAEALGGA